MFSVYGLVCSSGDAFWYICVEPYVCVERCKLEEILKKKVSQFIFR